MLILYQPETPHLERIHLVMRQLVLLQELPHQLRCAAASTARASFSVSPSRPALAARLEDTASVIRSQHVASWSKSA